MHEVTLNDNTQKTSTKPWQLGPQINQRPEQVWNTTLKHQDKAFKHITMTVAGPAHG